jgi:hypothetical protein
MGRSISFIAALLLVGGCLAGCEFPWDSSVTSQAAKDAMSAFTHDLNDPGRADQVGPDIRRLASLPSRDFSTGDWRIRSRLLASGATVFLTSWADHWVKARKVALVVAAGIDASTDTVFHAWDSSEEVNRFKEALGDVTEDAIRGQTCSDILNLVAPDPNPTATTTPDDKDWQGDIERDAEDVLAKTFGFTSSFIYQSVKWYNWYTDVTSAARQAEKSIASDQFPYENLLSSPAGLRATAIYARYCYAPPTTD